MSHNLQPHPQKTPNPKLISGKLVEFGKKQVNF